MNLEGFQDEIDAISGVSEVKQEGDTVYVKFFANPSNYLSRIQKLKEKYNIEQTERRIRGNNQILVYEER
jgi:hypothetical protein